MAIALFIIGILLLIFLYRVWTAVFLQLKIANHIKKETRILNAIEPMLNTGRLFARTTIQQTMLLSEMLAWSPIGSHEHDDSLDAVAGALVMTPSSTRALTNRVGLIKANIDFKI